MGTMWTSSEDNLGSDKAPADLYSSENRQFAIQQWEEAVFAVEQSLSPYRYFYSIRNENWFSKSSDSSYIDRETVTEPRKWATVLANLRRRVEIPGISPITKRLLVHIVPIP
jgi:hypothetical protein